MISLPVYLQSKKGFPEKHNQKKTKYIIDTDGGSDDAHAILTAVYCAKQTGCDILGITCVTGNVQLHDVIRNIKISLEVAGASSIPIFSGCDRNIQQLSNLGDQFFGQDGLSGYQDFYLKQFNLPHDVSQIIEKQHAVDFIIEQSLKHKNLFILMTRYKEELSIVCLGPMTNLACAVLKNHEIEKYIGHILFLGGNLLGVGFSSNAVAEFNIYCDREAASLVFRLFQTRLIIVPLETFVRMKDEWVTAKTFEFEGTEKGLFVKRIYENMKRLIKHYDIQDPLPLVIGMFPELVTEHIQETCLVSLHGDARGMMMIDWLNRMSPKPKCGRATIPLKYDEEKLFQLFHDILT